ncbi:ABC transporter permease [Persicirhabdus sediminis]|uniref:ABC transporter permease n=1 Tax=Persicirhabdus sediminis TaxID=454144 RepID=A0A8J7SM42_9BACT|nr:ABC transporter permease [Persicirhabdus sediminis]MBK1790848.1 ABC transporter permease [Persicirhabdus sediminis]
MIVKFALRLALASKVRLVWAALAIGSASCLVLWMLSSYDAVLRSHKEFAQRAMGEYDLIVDPISQRFDRHLSSEAVEFVRALDGVESADAMWSGSLAILNPLQEEVKPPPGSTSESTGVADEVLIVATEADAAPFDMASGKWLASQSRGDLLEVVISQSISDLYHLYVGGELLLGSRDHELSLKVIGIVTDPPKPLTGKMGASKKLPSPSVADAFVSFPAAETIFKRAKMVSFLGIKLAAETDIHKFRYRWGPSLGQLDPPVQFQQDFDLEEQLDEQSSAKNLKMQSIGSTALAMLLAFLVIFHALNMGVSERVRIFGMLRSICMTRGQIAGIVMVESLVFAALGFIISLFIYYMLQIWTNMSSGDVLSELLVLSPTAVLAAGVTTLGAALLAALVPAWRSYATSPLDALVLPEQRLSVWSLWKVCLLAFLGIVCSASACGLAFSSAPDAELHAFLILLAVVVLLVLGVILLIPATVQLVEKLVSPVLARVLSIEPSLLKQQMSANMGRTVGSAILVSVGLGIFISIQVWGMTMLEKFVPGQWCPTEVVRFEPYGVRSQALLDEADSYEKMGATVSPVFVEQPRLRVDITGSQERASITRQDNVIIVGADFARAGRSFSPFDFDFSDAEAERIKNEIRYQRGCIVPEHFLSDTGLVLGDEFEVVAPEDPAKIVRYKISATVDMAGWHWLTKSVGLRVRTHRTAALVIADAQVVAGDFDLFKPRFAMVRNSAADETWLDKLRADYQSSLAEEVTVYNWADRAEHRSLQNKDSADEHSYLYWTEIEDVRENIRTSATKWLWAASVLPLVALLIGCLGVMTVIVASVRSRRWQLGVLRAIGFSRWTLARLVVVEAVLIGLVGCFVSSLFGILFGWCGTALSKHVSFFGGMSTELELSISSILIGVVMTLVLVIFASLVPAISVGLAKPLDLLRVGRGGQ